MVMMKADYDTVKSLKNVEDNQDIHKLQNKVEPKFPSTFFIFISRK